MIYRAVPMKVRGSDAYGSGEFWAPRGDHKHNGIDLVCEKGDLVLSPVAGIVSKHGYPYDPAGPKGHKHYIEITDELGRRHRFFYCEPMLPMDSKVRQGQVIGEAQGLQDIYPPREAGPMTDHVHYEIKLRDGSFMDPTSMATN